MESTVCLPSSKQLIPCSKYTVWVENGGVVGRGVLLDYATWAKSQNRSPNLLSTTEITTSDLDAIVSSQGVTFQPGDILFIHSGYLKALESLSSSESDLKAYSTQEGGLGAIGVKSCEETLKWIWDKQLAAVAGDMIAFEMHPFQSKTHWLHEWLLAGWGMPIGELFDLERLANECRRLNKWSFFFSSVPLNVPGGVVSDQVFGEIFPLLCRFRSALLQSHPPLRYEFLLRNTSKEIR